MKPALLYFLLALAFLTAVLFTDGVYWADTPDYVDSVIAYHRGNNYLFWEFGHLLWRPLGWLVWHGVGSSGEMRKEIFSVFQWFDYIAGFVSVIALTALLRRLRFETWIVAFTVLVFIGTHSFLNFTQTGTSYVPALMFYVLGLLFFFREEVGSSAYLLSILSGVCLALSICFWVAFLWALPAAFLTGMIIYGIDRQRINFAIVSLIAFVATITVSYGLVLSILQIDSFSELRAWIASSSHGNETQGILRTVFGLARSFVNMGNDGMLFKRYILNDPFNPVSFGELMTGAIFKLAGFYITALYVLYTIWKNSFGKRILLLLVVTSLPLIGFAILFDGGAVERFLPLFPIVFVSLAVALQTENKGLKIVVFLGFAIFFLSNFISLSLWSIHPQQEKIVGRVEILKARLQANDEVFLVNWTDELMRFNRNFPFHPINSDGNHIFNAVVTQGTDQTRHWRGEFAIRSLRAWDSGGNVWLSSRAFALRPAADWNWAEGDDENVGWIEFPEFFGNLDKGQALGDENGFTFIVPSIENRAFLEKYKDRLERQIY